MNARHTSTILSLIPATWANGMLYTLGILDMNQITPMTGYLDDELEYTVLVPTAPFPEKMRHDPEFLAGCEFGYLCYEEKPETFLSIANLVEHVLLEELREPGAGFDVWLWTVGYLLGWLSHVAETEPTIAQVGLLHLCFLLTHLHPSHMENRQSLNRAFHDADLHHTLAMKAYRARVRELTDQGIELRAAYQQALTLYKAPDRTPRSSKKQKMGVVPPVAAPFAPKALKQVQGVVLPFRARECK